MAWTTPRTWVAGEIVTASMLNANIRDNMNIVGDPPRVQVYHNVHQSIAHNAWQALVFNSEVWDTDEMHDTVTNNGRLTVNTPGTYFAYAWVYFGSGSTGIRGLCIRKNAVTLGVGYQTVVGAITGARIQAIGEFQMNAGDYLSADAFQNNGAAIDVQFVSGISPVFGARRIAP